MLRWLFRLCLVAALAAGVGFALLLVQRGTDESYDAVCEPARAQSTGERIEFETRCAFWPTRVEILSDTPLTGFSSEIETERDVLIFGGGGPVCERLTAMRVVCDGEIDTDETFRGSYEPATRLCAAKVSLRVSGGGCSDFAADCNDIALSVEVPLPRPPENCGA